MPDQTTTQPDPAPVADLAAIAKSFGATAQAMTDAVKLMADQQKLGAPVIAKPKPPARPVQVVVAPRRALQTHEGRIQAGQKATVDKDEVAELVKRGFIVDPNASPVAPAAPTGPTVTKTT